MVGMTEQTYQGDVVTIIRSGLNSIAGDVGGVDMIAILNHRTAPQVYSVPLNAELAADLRKRCARTARDAAAAELRPWTLGHQPDRHQRLYASIPAGIASTVHESVGARTHPALPRNLRLAKQNVVVIRVFSVDGRILGSFYQPLSGAAMLAQSKKLSVVWTGDELTRLDDQALALRDDLRLIVIGDRLVITGDWAFEEMFGRHPELDAEADRVYNATLGGLDIENGDRLAKSCRSDINMMRKLASIGRKLQNPEYAGALTQENLVAFIRANPDVSVELIDVDGTTKIHFQADVQHRWAILKLLDDDYLRSDLTQLGYESNSKSPRQSA